MKKASALLAGLLGSVSAFATGGPDMTAITTAVDFGTVTAAVLGVAAAIVVVRIAFKGGKEANSAVKSM